MTDSINDKRPMASPWILGLYGLAGATFIVAAHSAGWYGGPQSVWLLAPFAAILGGIAQFLAGMWAYAAADGVATAMLGAWGSFWVAYGVLNGLFATGRLAEPKGAFPELALWFIVLAAITWMGAVAATARSAALTIVFGFLAAGSTISAISEGLGNHGLSLLAAWLFIVAAIVAWYTATALMLEETFRRRVLPVGDRLAGKPEPSTGALHHAPTLHRAG